VSVNIQGLEGAMTGQLPGALRDLIRLSAFVLAADCAIKRGTLKNVDGGKSWRRDLRFVVPVADPALWSQPQLKRELETTLDFLSDDQYRFHFVPGQSEEGRQLTFSPPEGKRTFAGWDGVEQVMLFSGGMDSFGGAVEEALQERRKVVLVSHRSSPKMIAVQRRLVKELRLRNRSNFPLHIGIDIHKHDDALRQENTQRSRSFLYASVASAVAWLAGTHAVRFYENGIIALNVPINRQLVGARGTRTAHPRVLAGFAKILGMLTQEDYVFDNPYLELTRADVAGRIRDAGARDLLRHTRSCAGVRTGTRGQPFCGVCSQCVDRQFAARAAGMLDDDPEEMYELQIFDHPMKKAHDIQLGLAYVGTARQFAKVGTGAEFQSIFGEINDALPELAQLWECGTSTARERVRVLHQRHGQMVVDVLGRELHDRAAKLIDGTQHPESLLSRCVEQGQQASKELYGETARAEGGGGDDEAGRPEELQSAEGDGGDANGAVNAPVDPVEVLQPGALMAENTFIKVGDAWLVGLRGKRGLIVKDFAGMPLIRVLLAHSGRELSVLELEAAAKGELVQPKPKDLGPKMDAAYVAEVRKRLPEIELEMAAAAEMCDQQEVLRLRAEKESLEDRITEAHGLGGAVRQVAPEVEKARSRATRAVERSIKHITKLEGGSPLGRHLHSLIRRGFTFAYQDEERAWKTES